MATIRKRGKAYSVRWREGATQKERTCPDLPTARKLKAEVEHAQAHGERWAPLDFAAEPGLEEAFAAYGLDRKRTLQPATRRLYKGSLMLFLDYCERTQRTKRPLLASLDRATLAGFYDWATGPHGSAQATVRNHVQRVQSAWRWLYEDDRFGDWTPRPRRFEMPAPPATITRAPAWQEVDRTIEAANMRWHRRLLWLLRFTGLRVNQARHLEWSDFDFDSRELTVGPELGKTRQERTGRVIPVSAHLLAEMKGWGKREGLIILPRNITAVARASRLAWKRAKVDPELWRGHPHHAIRRAFVSGLTLAGADKTSIEVLVGHSLGLVGAYLDTRALPLRETVDLIPPMGACKVVSLDRAAGQNSG